MERKSPLGFRLHSLHNDVLHYIDQRARSQGIDPLTLSNVWILDILYVNQEKDVFQKDIEVECGISRSTVAGLVKLMEQKGYIVRESIPEDMRMKKLTMTEAGLQIYLEMSGILEEFENRVLENLSLEERTLFIQLLRRMQRALQ